MCSDIIFRWLDLISFALSLSVFIISINVKKTVRKAIIVNALRGEFDSISEQLTRLIKSFNQSNLTDAPIIECRQKLLEWSRRFRLLNTKLCIQMESIGNSLFLPRNKHLDYSLQKEVVNILIQFKDKLEKEVQK